MLKKSALLLSVIVTAPIGIALIKQSTAQSVLPPTAIDSPVPKPVPIEVLGAPVRTVELGDVIALWLYSSEFSNTVRLKFDETGPLRANPVLVVGIVSAFDDKYVTIARRRWFSSTAETDDQFYEVELIPREMVTRVQVLGSSGTSSTDSVNVNFMPSKFE